MCTHSFTSSLAHCSLALRGIWRRNETVSPLLLLEKLPFFSSFRLHPPGLLMQLFPEGLNLKQMEAYCIFGSGR